ncbi:SNW/SKI-interacting protein [Seminavis robusta]|uniref:SNW/SKI-interacting protein n=1 Tax=Seminavis robusta TaxID=568900 RepID=A0A9N8DJN7_9STRA|nr:SNW/SKI-interacting protein [Seminavis robusta]|eukprot:Sro178_g078130.1 SNW/SKI-interacting protein (577) ;mRNA; f:36521-38251
MAPALTLPPPRNAPPGTQQPAATAGKKKAPPNNTKPRSKAPSYAERCCLAREAASKNPEERRRGPKLFVPRSLQDFDDGGAYPEIHVAQYPRHMGNPHLKKTAGSGAAGAQTTSKAIVSVQVDKDGEVSYDAIVKGGTNSDKTVYSRYEDLAAKEAKEEDIALPTAEEEEATTAKTKAALDMILGKHTALDKPSGTAIINAQTSQNQEAKTQFIKYTPNPDAPGYNPAAAQRVIQMVPKQVDPMMPPKHKHIQAPRGPAEDPVPVLHAPAKKLTKEEREAWNIPSCISNWKNTRGYTIPLDKRLAADGRGLREHTINPDFATLSESLYVAERQARQEVRLRAQVQKKLALQEKERREEELRELANQARLERSGVVVAPPKGGGDESDLDDDGEDGIKVRTVRDTTNNSSSEPSNAHKIPATDDEVAAAQRERLRMARKREREKELRMEQQKKQKFEDERDVSEQIALGVHQGTGALAGEVDARLYNQSAGMDSGFGREDEYNTYSKPLFDRTAGVSGASIYRPSRDEQANADDQYAELKAGATSKFQAGKGFAGAEGGMAVSAGPRTGPVQFEKNK